MDSITPILLSGGAGTRLWPVSRKALPKQFAQLIGDESLFVGAARRLSSLNFHAPIIVTGDEYRFLVRDQLAQAQVKPGCVLIEPEGRNTAPAILAAALIAQETNPEALLLAAPSDHLIADTQAFGQAIQTGVEVAQNGAIVTFGITPTRPETGYGYLELAGTTNDKPVVLLSRFVEKPDAEAAAAMLASGNYLWNAGIFLFRADTLVDAFATHQPAMLEQVRAAVANRTEDLGFERLAAQPWSDVESISIDYAIMEKSDHIMVVPYNSSWSDLGDWDALWRESTPNEAGVVTVGDATALDCTSTYLRSDNDDLAVVGIGLDNVMVVATQDAVLVADKSKAQHVKRAVDVLSQKGSKQAEAFPRDHRPWGWYDILALSERFQVKRIVVNPGAALSLQSHMHRAEHWIVVTGTARVTVDGQVKLVGENESVYVPLGAKHQLENPGKVPMELIEVQSGSYLGEDDIVRYDDPYRRF
ncbi:MAG: mannose-1-phosphate guanylyltransferase/mannose-6-phosphate isomerase [Hyphomicrobiales bacterium]|jgi:mannose-1-phosphate guanylyltransferase/mannose-6-phosphate isomerase